MTQITPAHVDEIKSHLRSRLDQMGARKKSKRAMEAEYNFLAGAATAINAIYPNKDKSLLSDEVPRIWMVNPMCGRSVFDT